LEAYGMTEASHQMAINPLPPGVRKPGSVGLATGIRIGIMDDAGNLLARGALGEVVIHGETVTHGYEDNPDANAKAFTDGWFRTGDQGYLDEDGYLFLTGRLKEIINRGGEKISPREVDEALLAHPDVAQALAFAMPDPALGEEVAAVIVRREGAAVTERALRDFVAARLAEFKVPRRIVFLEEIPRGPTGKLQRIGLAERLGLTAEPQPAPVEVSFVEPSTPVEEFLASIWREVLGVEQVGVAAPFLHLGGDSLLATRIVARIRDAVQIEVTLRDFFDTPTIAEMAAIIEQKLLDELPE
jgi:acyl carrier protein